MSYIYHDTANGCMNYVAKNATLKNISAGFHAVKIIECLDCNDTPPQLVIEMNESNCNFKVFSIEAPKLNDTQTVLAELAKHGIVLKPKYKMDVCNYLVDEYNRCRINQRKEYYHRRLGWYDDNNGQKVFLYDKNIINGKISTYADENFDFQKGNKADYEKFLREVIYPVPTLALAMSFSYSAAVVSLLSKQFDLGTVVINLCGASSTGKSTVSQLIGSAFANPAISNSGIGLVRTFHSTTTAMFRSMDGINGLPMALDDSTANNSVSNASFLYTLASGEEKARCGKDLSLNSGKNGWSGVIVFSSETPILDSVEQYQGLKARVLQTQGITWTPDAETAEKIKAFVQQNYGFTGKEFADFIANIPFSDLCNQFEESRKKVHSFMKSRDNLSDRLETKYSAIYLTITLMNKCFHLTLDPDELIEILLAPEQANVIERDISQKALLAVSDFIIQKRAHFRETEYNGFRRVTTKSPSGDDYGTINICEDTWDVLLPTSILEQCLKSHGIYEFATVKSRWKKSGILQTDNGRYDCKHRHRRCIHFVFSKGLYDEVDDSLNTINPMNQQSTDQSAPVDSTDQKVPVFQDDSTECEDTVESLFGDMN